MIQTVTMPVEGMTCASCVARVERTLAAVHGVSAATVNLASEKVIVRFDGATTSLPALAEAVAEAGYTLRTDLLPHNGPGLRPLLPGAVAPQEASERGWRRDLWIALAFALPVMLLSMTGMLGMMRHVMPLTDDQMSRILLVLTTPVMIVAGRRFYVHAWKLARQGSADMNTLVAVGTGSAFVYSAFASLFPEWMPGHGEAHHVYFETATAIVTLVLLGKTLESRAKRRTADAIQTLVALQPDHARVKRGNLELDVPIGDLAMGDVLVIRPGERLAADGIVLAGASAIDESIVTGESLPVEKNIGDRVIGGTVNANGTLEVQTTAVGADTVMARIVRLVEEAQGSRAPIQRIADRVAAVFVPVVITLALLTFVVWFAVLHAGFAPAMMNFIAVLVIACPCAMGLATPAAIIVGTGRGAASGILIRNAASLERAHEIRTIVFDKTGTITEGKPSVSGVQALNGFSEETLLTLAASAESRSEHPLAMAVVQCARDRGLSFGPPETFEALPGSGVRATVGGRRLFVASLHALERAGISTAESGVQAEAWSAQGKSLIGVAIADRFIGLIAIGDRIRPEARRVIEDLHKNDVTTVLLTGDNATTATAVAREIGIRLVLAEVLPDRKAEEIHRLQTGGSVVAMVGDGINDAPALASADVGIAMGSGAHAAIETADITLMRSDLGDVIRVLGLSRATVRTVKQNLFWAFFYNIIGIPLAAIGVLNPILAAGAMAFSSVSVVSNSLRLRRIPL